MNLDFFPNDILKILNLINTDKLYQIRLRLGYPIQVVYDEKEYYLDNGLSIIEDKSLKCTKHHIDTIINNLTENSLYAFNDRIKQGYLTSKEGVRIGICGECVFNNDTIKTIKNITSLNIRIPHLIENCSNEIFKHIYSGKVFSTLIISPPFYGKTTILKDLALKLNSINGYSILIIDERGEFCMVSGKNIDKISYSDKLFAFNYALRTMSPNIIITDELSTECDWKCALLAKNSGTEIIASCHGDSASAVNNKPFFINGIFDKYVVLDNSNGIGSLCCVQDCNFNKI